MKIYLFKIEQFFDEQLVLNAELQYPFVGIDMKNDGSNKLRFHVNDAKTQIELDSSHEFITDMSCSCDNYKKEKSCIHLVMAAWEVRKQGFPEQKAAQSRRLSPQASSIIQEMDVRSLRQFLSGYASRNKEFNLVIKLLFSHEVSSNLPYETIRKQVYDLFELFRSSLNTKKHQKTFEFYLRTYLGVAEDLIARKDYRSGGFYALASWELWMDKAFHMTKISSAKANYEQVLKVLGRIERSPISPELYKYIFKTISQKIQEEEAHPILEYDIPELLMDWKVYSEEEYTYLILRKIAQPRSTEFWISRFFNNIESYSRDQLDFARQYIQKLSIDKILRKLEGAQIELDERSFFYIISLKGHFTKNYVRRLQQIIAEEFKFLAELHLLTRFGAHEKIESLLYQTEFSEDGLKALDQYLNTQAVASWIRLLIRHQVFDQKDVFQRLENIEDPKEWIHLLSHLKSDQQKVVFEKIKAYCLDFASNHLGVRARQHLQTIGQMLTLNGFAKEWAEIREEIVTKFDHRKSIQSMENPFL